MATLNLDEAINHAELQASLLGHSDCGDDHRQLAEWLKELKWYRETYPNSRPLFSAKNAIINIYL